MWRGDIAHDCLVGGYKWYLGGLALNRENGGLGFELISPPATILCHMKSLRDAGSGLPEFETSNGPRNVLNRIWGKKAPCASQYCQLRALDDSVNLL